MTEFADVPLWAALPIALLVVAGSSLALIGSFGLYRIRSFYDRLHAPTLGTSGGTVGVILASMVLFSVLGSRLVVHEILLGIFIVLTTPVTLMLLGRAALHRDQREGGPDLPPRERDAAAGAGEDLGTVATLELSGVPGSLAPGRKADDG